MRPDSTPVDPKLFPTERCEQSENDATALDQIAEYVRRRLLVPSYRTHPHGISVRNAPDLRAQFDPIIRALASTGRVVE